MIHLLKILGCHKLIELFVFAVEYSGRNGNLLHGLVIVR